MPRYFRCVFLLLCALTVNQAAEPQPRSLARVNQFDLESRLPSDYHGLGITHAVAAKHNALYLLISPPRTLNPPQALLKLDAAGNREMFMPLVRPADPTWLDIGDSGEIYVRTPVRPSDPGEIDVYTPGGKLQKSIHAAKLFVELGRSDGRFWGVTPEGKLMPFTSTEGDHYLTEIRIRRAFSLHLRPVLTHAVAAVDPNVPVLWVVDTRSGKSIHNKIVAPEISRAWEVYRQDPSDAVIVDDITTDVDGRIYANISGHPLSTGAVVLVFNSNGEQIESLRCPPAVFDARRGPGNPDGYLSGGLLAVSDGQLFVVDRLGYVATYRLD